MTNITATCNQVSIIVNFSLYILSSPFASHISMDDKTDSLVALRQCAAVCAGESKAKLGRISDLR